MPIDKIYDLSFWNGFFWFCFCVAFCSVGFFVFFPFPACSNGAYRFSPKQVSHIPDVCKSRAGVHVCWLDLCFCEMCGQQRGKKDTTEKKPKITSQWPHIETQVLHFSMSFQLWEEIKISFLSLTHMRNIVLPLILVPILYTELFLLMKIYRSTSLCKSAYIAERKLFIFPLEGSCLTSSPSQYFCIEM